MNRQILQASASEWVRQAKNDIRTKMLEFMHEVNTSRSELAYALAISEGELAQILDGNGEITLTTFAKLLIATGNVLEIKPIEESPLAMENGAPVPPVGGQPQGRTPQGRPFPPRPFGAPRPGGMPHRPGAVPPPPPGGLYNDFHRQGVEEPVAPVGMQPRGADGRFRPWPRQPQPEAPKSPFATMEREKLVEIIQNKLWDTEIDVDNVSHEQLVRFLEDKDKRMAELREARERKKFEEDPSVVDFINKVKKAVETNPNLSSKLKDILR